MNKKISIIGIGMNGISTLTKEAEKAVHDAELLIGASRMLEPFKHLKKHFYMEYQSAEIARYIGESSANKIAVLMSGDCGFFSGAEKLKELLSEFETKIICGISSPVYFCSKLGLSWNDMHFVSLHGKSGNISRIASAHEKVFFLLGGNHDAAGVCRRLCQYGLGKVTVYIGENLGYPDEKISSGSAESFSEYKAAGLSVMITVNKDYEKFLRTSIPDKEFIRGRIPMTKSEVRGSVVSKLEIRKDDICWDIGSGTGSVSVEMAMRCEKGKVYAVEKKAEAAELTRQNSRKFHCDNIEVINSYAAEALERLPVPDCIFIGGSGGELKEIICGAYQKNRNVRIAVTAVTVESLSRCTEIFNELGLEADISQLAVTRTEKAGSYTMFRAENPVFIITSSGKPRGEGVPGE